MTNDPSLKTRREFLRSTVLGSALTWTVPTFLANTFASMQAEAADSATQIVTGKDSTILVVLQMAGGNDGINTVVPYSNDFYHKARPKLGQSADNVIKLNDSIGFHGKLDGFKSLYDAGELAVVQGVGYPNPNRSHFRSTEIWQTASDSEKYDTTGWLGRYFDNACAGADPTVGITIGNQTPQAFAARKPMGICFNNPANYRFQSDDTSNSIGMGATEEQSYRKLNDSANAPEPSMLDGAPPSDNSGGSIGAISGPAGPQRGSPLDFIERTAMDAQMSSDQIRAIVAKAPNVAAYPQTALGNNLKLVGKLIAGGMPTRVYYVSQGGYDTHVNQVPTQERLLKELGDAVKAFTDDLKSQGNMQRVLVMTFSEFGRRVTENASGGTDHGAAAPMFIVGNKVSAGLLGRYPSLAPGDLFEGDIKYTVDFRTVYAGVLENWLKTKSIPVLGRKFEPLAIV